MVHQQLRDRLAMLTVSQAVMESGQTPEALQSLLDSGQLPCFRMGEQQERIRILRCDLQRITETPGLERKNSQ